MLSSLSVAQQSSVAPYCPWVKSRPFPFAYRLFSPWPRPLLSFFVAAQPSHSEPWPPSPLSCRRHTAFPPSRVIPGGPSGPGIPFQWGLGSSLGLYFPHHSTFLAALPLGVCLAFQLKTANPLRAEIGSPATSISPTATQAVAHRGSW